MFTQASTTVGRGFLDLGQRIAPTRAPRTRTAGANSTWRQQVVSWDGAVAAPRSVSQRAPAVSRIVISRSTDDDRQFQVSLEQRGATLARGLLRQQQTISADCLQELRQSYERQIRVLHELSAAGVPVPPPDESRLLILGRRIADLLPGIVRQEIVTAVRRARQGRRALRLALEVTTDAREWLSVPWELMALPLGWGPRDGAGQDDFLFLNADVALVRQVRGVGLNMPLALSRPLRIQAFAAAPLYAQSIDLSTTYQTIEQVRPAADAPRHWYDGHDTLSVLQERLSETHPQVVHLVCHGERSDTGRGRPRYDLLFTHLEGYAHRVGATDLARALTLAPDLQLVVLQACHSGATVLSSGGGVHDRHLVESIALTLVRSGVPTVIAMQGEVGQGAAAAFARACYIALAQGRDLDRAVAAGRIAMRSAGGVVDWSLPVVYQGSGPMEQDSWYIRLANRLRALFPGTRLAKAPALS